MKRTINFALESIGGTTLSVADFIGAAVTGDLPVRQYSGMALLIGVCAVTPVGNAQSQATVSAIPTDLIPLAIPPQKEKSPEANPAITVSMAEYIASTSGAEPKEEIKKSPLTKRHLRAYKKVKRTIAKVTTDPFYQEYLLFVARAESQYGLRQVSFTGAKGIWQFTGKTARIYKLDDPFHPVKAAKAAKALAKDNRRGLISKGIEPTVENTYYTHMIGLSGLVIVKKASTGSALTTREKRKFNHVLGSNMSKPMLNKYFTGVGKAPQLRPEYTHQEVAQAYLNLFEQRATHYRIDNFLLSQGKLA